MAAFPVVLILFSAPNRTSGDDLVFAHVVAGGGFSTTFTLVNTGSSAATGNLVLTDQSGSPMDVTWSPSPAVDSTFPISLQPGATAVVTAQRPGATDVKAGWARLVIAAGSIGGVATFQWRNGAGLKAVAGVLASDLKESVSLPVDNSDPDGRFSGFAVANPGSGNVRLTVMTLGQNGFIADVVSPDELNPLGPGCQVARFVHDYLPERVNFRGAVLLSAGGGEKVAVVALNQNRGLYTAIPVIAQKPAWKLVWSDEFDGPEGSAPDSSKWAYDLGGGGWGNNELEYYTNRLDNSHVESGRLVIKAIKEDFGGRNYTSARLKTQGKFTVKYGRIEARLKVPRGQGLWPAFWMLGEDISTAGWPACGEIDIMENIGREPSTAYGTLHVPRDSLSYSIGGWYILPGGQAFADDFHVFTIDWDPDVIRWYVDGNLFQTRTPADFPLGARWVFDHPFFIIMNVAVGGRWPGNPDSTTVFPQTMTVDYVRVFERVP